MPGLNEVAGTSAAGKTQFCLQLCLNVQLPRKQGGLEGGLCTVVSVGIIVKMPLKIITE